MGRWLVEKALKVIESMPIVILREEEKDFSSYIHFSKLLQEAKTKRAVSRSLFY
jgi:hypothetical protein